MNKIFLGIMLLFLFSVSSCLNEENDVMGPNNLNQVDTRLSVSEAEDVLRSFVVGTDTKSNTSFRIKSHTVKNVYIENAQNLQVTVSDTIPVYEFLTETDGQEGYSVVVGDKRIEKGGWDGDSNGFYLVEDPVSFSAEGFLFNSNFRMVLDIRK